MKKCGFPKQTVKLPEGDMTNDHLVGGISVCVCESLEGKPLIDKFSNVARAMEMLGKL